MSDARYFEKDPEAERLRQRLVQSGATIYRSWGACWGPGEVAPFCVVLGTRFVVEHYEQHETRAATRLAGMQRAVEALEKTP